MKHLYATILALIMLTALPAAAQQEFATVPALHPMAVGFGGTQSDISDYGLKVLGPGSTNDSR